jgi:hypothetical protein
VSTLKTSSERMRIRLRVLLATILMITWVLVGAIPAHAAIPNFQLPFPCGETWHASTYSDHGAAIDWNDYPDDNGHIVVASAGGTASLYYEPLGGYQVIIDHGAGWQTVYAHLQQAGRVSGPVTTGQPIGKVGNTGGLYPNGEQVTFSPHLHWEQKLNGVRKSPLYANGAAINPGGVANSSAPAYVSANCGVTSSPNNGTDTFGSYNPATAEFHITNAMTPTAAEATFTYGNTNWLPLIGDWNGNGTDTFGSYNPATATFYITNAASPTTAEATFAFGNSGWTPLIGDWDGNGTDTFGSYNPATATFNITNAMTPTAAEATFTYGNTNWLPLIGDWDGNGTDTFGSYNPATATFYISNAGIPTTAEASFAFGNSGWTPLIGDWDGNGTDTFGSYNPATAMFYITNTASPTTAEATFAFGNSGWLPLIGDWNDN